MPRIVITGSSEGFGRMAGRLPAERGREVVLRERCERRPMDARHALSDTGAVVISNVTTTATTRALANSVDRFDTGAIQSRQTAPGDCRRRRRGWRFRIRQPDAHPVRTRPAVISR